MHRIKKLSPGERAYLEASSPGSLDPYRRVLDALSLKRRTPSISLTKAAKSSGTTLKTIRRYASSALEVRSGRLDVKRSDRLPRPMRMLTPRGEVTVPTKSFRTASWIGKYNNALREFYVTGDSTAVKRFADKSIRSGGKTYEFVTDTKTLNRLARAGAVHFVDVYAPEASS